MKKMIRHIGILLFGILIFNACSDNSLVPDPNNNNQTPAPTLTANIDYMPQSPEVGTQVTLDASGSTDDQGIGYQIQWSLSSKPSSSSTTINSADQVQATFTPDVPGDYVVSLEISNSSEGVSDDASTTISAVAVGPTELSGTITQDSTLKDIFDDPSAPDYLVTGNLDVEATLTVEPGVIVYFQENTGMRIGSQSGVISAVGESANKIVFTGESQSTNGFWTGINIYSNTVENKISHVEINYAGSKSAGTYFEAAALTIDRAKVQLSDVTISHSGGYGIQTRRSGSEFPMSNMTFESNDLDHAYVHLSQLGYFDAASTFDGGFVTTFNGATTADMEIVALNGAKYQILSNVDFEHHVTIAKGTAFEFVADAGIVVRNGSVIEAVGTQDHKIVFTGTSKSPGAWRGIFIGSASVDNIMEHVDISYGGSTNMATYFGKTNMVIDNAKITLRNVSFTGSAGYGIETRRSGSEFSLENSAFNNNADSDMLIHPTQISGIDNQTNFNGGDVEVYKGDTESTGSETWSNLNNGTYYLTSTVSIEKNVTVEAGALFEMGTDVVLKVPGGNSPGSIKAIGTSNDPIVFTGRSKAKGAWGGIWVSSGSLENEMDHVLIEYGGGKDLDIYMSSGNLGVHNDAYLELSNAAIENSANYGIIVRDSRGAQLNMGSNITYFDNSNDNLYTY